MRISLAALVVVAGPAAAADPAKYIAAELIAESATPRPGTTVLIGFRMTPKPGWHGYWSNPGESGFAPNSRWKAPTGVTLGPLLHPAPTLLRVSGMSSFVHQGPHVLLARMTIARRIAPGTSLPIVVALNWAACTATQCVPLHATLRLNLTAGDGAKGPNAAALQVAARKLPRPAPAGTFTIVGKTVRLHLPPSIRLDPRRVRFFPDATSAFDAAASRAVIKGQALVISAPLRGALSGTISGVASDGRSACHLTFVRRNAAPRNR